MALFTGNLSKWSRYQTFQNPTNRTWDDLEINIFADKNPFLIASSSNNKFYAMFDLDTLRWLTYILTNNNTINGAKSNFIRSNNDVGIYATEIPTHLNTYDQATGVFINTQRFPYLKDFTFGVRYHQGDSNLIVKGFSLGVEYK